MPQVKPKLKNKAPKPKRVATREDRKLVGFDTETSGIDLHHGASVFFVTTCDEEHNQKYWEWEVDPLTRKVQPIKGDLIEIEDLIMDDNTQLVLQNGKFDSKAIATLPRLNKLKWPWHRTYDTLIAGHLLASNQPHDLTSMMLIYTGINIKPYEDALKVACTAARALAKKRFPNWMIAKSGIEGMPSIKSGGSKKEGRGAEKDTLWKFDAWLPKQLYNLLPNEVPKEWDTACAEYANPDSFSAVELMKVMRSLLQERGYWKVFLERMKLPPILCEMEVNGLTLSRNRLEEQMTDFTEKSEAAGKLCVSIAKSYGADLVLPKSGNNGSLLNFVFDTLGLESPKKSKKTGKPSLDKEVIEHYQATLPTRSKSLLFVNNLRGKRQRDTAIGYMEGYQRFWLPDLGEYMRLHSWLNPTGSDTLRLTSNSPNEQNISKKEDFNLRYAFGPADGREWWSLDCKNIELRIPAYVAGETAMIELFERPDDPPYYGSNHLLFFDILHPEKFAKHGKDVKKVYASTWYQWTKNGDFAVQYNAQEGSGTADRAYHVEGAHKKINERLTNIKKLSDLQIELAEEQGYVETLPDRSVDPEHGYPLLCTRTKWGGIKSTVPLSYFVQGTAMWVMFRMMVKVQTALDVLNRGISKINREGYFIAAQIHDEIVLDFPYVEDMGNLNLVMELKRVMDSIGSDLVPAMPLPVGIEYHPNHWAEGVTVA